jgi:hypothetical protein
MVMSFQSALPKAHSTVHQPTPAVPVVVSIWTSFEEPMTVACDKLRRVPRRQVVDWVTDEVRNFSSKNKDAWIHLCNNRNSQVHPTSTFANYRSLLRIRLRILGGVHKLQLRRAWAVVVLLFENLYFLTGVRQRLCSPVMEEEISTAVYQLKNFECPRFGRHL